MQEEWCLDMMNNDKHYIKEINKIINVDPIKLELTRVEEVGDGYGGNTTVKTKANVIGRLYNKKSVRELADVKGEYIGLSALAAEKLLTLSDVDVKKGDTFKVDDRNYRVHFVNDYLGLCKQIELEVLEIGTNS